MVGGKEREVRMVVLRVVKVGGGGGDMGVEKGGRGGWVMWSWGADSGGSTSDFMSAETIFCEQVRTQPVRDGANV